MREYLRSDDLDFDEDPRRRPKTTDSFSQAGAKGGRPRGRGPSIPREPAADSNRARLGRGEAPNSSPLHWGPKPDKKSLRDDTFDAIVEAFQVGGAPLTPYEKSLACSSWERGVARGLQLWRDRLFQVAGSPPDIDPEEVRKMRKRTVYVPDWAADRAARILGGGGNMSTAARAARPFSYWAVRMCMMRRGWRRASRSKWELAPAAPAKEVADGAA